MGLLDGSLQIISDALIGGTDFDRFNNDNARLAVGNSGAAFDSSHTALQGASQVDVGMEPGSPSRDGAALTFIAKFDGNTGNFNWLEWGVTNGTNLFNRALQNLGTKAAGTTWTLTAEIEPLLGLPPEE